MLLDSGSPCSAPFNLKGTAGEELLKCLKNQMKLSTSEQQMFLDTVCPC